MRVSLDVIAAVSSAVRPVSGTICWLVGSGSGVGREWVGSAGDDAKVSGQPGQWVGSGSGVGREWVGRRAWEAECWLPGQTHVLIFSDELHRKSCRGITLRGLPGVTASCMPGGLGGRSSGTGRGYVGSRDAGMLQGREWVGSGSGVGREWVGSWPVTLRHLVLDA